MRHAGWLFSLAVAVLLSLHLKGGSRGTFHGEAPWKPHPLAFGFHGVDQADKTHWWQELAQSLPAALLAGVWSTALGALGSDLLQLGQKRTFR